MNDLITSLTDFSSETPIIDEITTFIADILSAFEGIFDGATSAKLEGSSEK